MTDRIEEPEVNRDESEDIEEVVKEAPIERVQLEDAMVESEAVVERSGDYVEAEAIETALVDVVKVQAIEERPEGEEGQSVEDNERVAEVVVEAHPEAVEDVTVEETRTEGGEEVPVVEVMQVSELPLEEKSTDTRPEAPGRIEIGAEPDQEVTDKASNEDQVIETEFVPESIEEGESWEETDSGDAGEEPEKEQEAGDVGEEPEEEQDAGDKENPPNGLGSSLMDGEEKDPEDDVPPTTSDGSESEGESDVGESWVPPEMYMHVASDGSRTIVDADGNVLDCPPVYQLVVDSSGKEHIQVIYPIGDGEAHKFEISFYNIPMEGMKAHYGSDGTINVVDLEGNVLKSPPIITKVVDGSGVEHAYAQYPGMESTQKVELEAYNAPIDTDRVFAYKGQDGKIQIVDADGKPLAIPPVVTGYIANKSGDKFAMVNYLGGGSVELQKGTQVSWFQAPLDGLFVHVGQDGSYTVVDGTGKAVDSPPVINKVIDSKGVEHINATYQGVGEKSVKGELQFFTAPLEALFKGVGPNKSLPLFIHEGSDGSITVVDKSGKPIESPPIITKVMDGKGSVQYQASYPGVSGEPLKEQASTADVSSEGPKWIFTSYTAPITDMYAHVGQDGSITVVDSDGEPVDSPPVIQKIVDSKGVQIIQAVYPGDPSGTKPVILSYYVPTSSS